MNYRYRGKRIDTKEWIYGWLIIESLLYGTKASIRVPAEDHEDIDHTYQVEWPTVGAMLDIKDMKGTYVYEGDILLVKGNPDITKDEYLNQKYVMEWNREKFHWYGKPLNIPHSGLFLAHIPLYAEIVGNIYDKPEQEYHKDKQKV